MTARPHPPGARSAEVGARVRAAREQLGLTQTVLGDLLGWTQQVVAKLEVGKTNMRTGQLLDLAWALNVEPGVLLAGLEAMKEDGSLR